MERLSAYLHRRIYGHHGYLCARAAWRGGVFWRAWRVCFYYMPRRDGWRLRVERDHCHACLFRWLAGED